MFQCVSKVFTRKFSFKNESRRREISERKKKEHTQKVFELIMALFGYGLKPTACLHFWR